MAILPQVGSRIGRGTVTGYGGLAVFPHAGDRVFLTGVNTVGIYVRDIESPGFLSGIAAPNKNPANGQLAGSNFWCGRQDSNLHTLRRWNLNPFLISQQPLQYNASGHFRDTFSGKFWKITAQTQAKECVCRRLIVTAKHLKVR
jgi:hypothetical protein